MVEDDDERNRRRRRRREQQEGNIFNNNVKESSTTETTTINGTVTTSSFLQETVDNTTATTILESSQTSVSSSSSLYAQGEDNSSPHSSHIIRINAETRLAHLAAILPLSSWNNDTRQRELVDFRVYLQISVYLAWHHLQQHLNKKSINNTNNNNVNVGIILPDVAQRLQGCDLQFSLQLHDSQFSPLQAARQLVNILMQTQAQVIESSSSSSSSSATAKPAMPTGRKRAVTETTINNDAFHQNGLEISPIPEEEDEYYDSNNSTLFESESPPAQQRMLLPPMAIMGAARSAVTATLSGLSSVYGIPQISGSSTASILDDKSRHPLLARTVPTNAGDARATILYLQHPAVNIQHLVVLYIGDDFGTNYHAAIVREANARQVSIRSIQYTTEQSMDSALYQLKESGMRYVLAILNPQSWKQLLARAALLNLAGPGTGYTWYLTEANLEVSNPEFALDISTRSTKNNNNNNNNNPHKDDDENENALVARALHGAGIILIHIPDHAAMDQALQDFRHDTVLQQDFVSLYHDDDDHEAKMLLLQNFTYPPIGRSFYQYLYYDAIMALGIAACETTSRDLFTGQDLYQQLLQTEFQGVSGTVSFDPLTGTRRAENFQFRIVNLIRKDNDDGMVRFQTQIVALVHPLHGDYNNNATGMGSTNNNEIVELLAPFVYADSTTRVPADLNPLVEDLNLITPAFRGVGLTLGLLAMISSIGWMIWTLCHRKKDVVLSSQPFFLVQLCIGTLIMSSAIIPLSLQEPVSDRVLSMCCMMVPWLISLGFVTSFSALFSKTWRLRRLYAAGRRCRRIRLAPKDVMLPFIVLLTMNLTLLVAWSIVAPLTWERVALDNFDAHGRTVESVGSCRVNDELKTQVLPFAILILAVNIVALVFATHQAYLAREIPTEFFEAGYVFVSFASLLETFIIGVPLLFVGSTDPNASFLIRSILITICCLAIQLPVFVPKYNKRKTVLEEERLNGSSGNNTSSVNVFIDGRRVNVSALSLQGQAGGSIPRSLRNLFGTPDRGESTTETSAMSSPITATTSTTKVGRSLVRRTPKYYKEEELKRRRGERSRSSSAVGATGGLGSKPASLYTLFEARDQQRQQLSRSQSDRPGSISLPPLAMEVQDSKRSVTSKTSEVDHSANLH